MKNAESVLVALRVMTGMVRCPYPATERGKHEIENTGRLV